jgi:CheY-like chemotaxis protein
MTKANILIIGGDESLVTLVRNFLEDYGHSVHLERDADSGFENLTQNSYDAVLVHSVSWKRGVPRPCELIRQIKHLHRSTPVLVATASVTTEQHSSLKPLLEAGATRVLVSGAPNSEYLRELLEELGKHVPQAVA